MDRRPSRGAVWAPGAGATAKPRSPCPIAAHPAPRQPRRRRVPSLDPGPGRLGQGGGGAGWRVARARPSGTCRAAPPLPEPPSARHPSRPGPPVRPPARAPAPGATHVAMPLPRGAPPGNSRIPIGGGRVRPRAPRVEAEGPRAEPPAAADPGAEGELPARVRAAPRACARPRRAPPRRLPLRSLPPALRGAGAAPPLQPRSRCSPAGSGPLGRRALTFPPPGTARGSPAPGERGARGALCCPRT